MTEPLPQAEPTVERLKQSLLTMDRVATLRQIREAAEAWDPLVLVEGLVVPALESIGEDWEAGSVALSQVYMSGRIAEELVEEALQARERVRVPQPSMGIVVLEDFHLLGKRIIHSVLRASGYVVEDLGQMALATLVQRLRDHPLDILFVSTLMLRAALRVRELRDELDRLGIATRLVVGGAPFRFDPNLATEVGAHATADSAAELMPLVARLVEESL